MKQQKMLNTNKGITLIALVITIIVMLILVAVTISMAVNGGLFEYAGNAGKETNNAIRDEQQVAGGQVTIDNTVYNSIDDYLNKDAGTTLISLYKKGELKVGDYVDYNPAGATSVNPDNPENAEGVVAGTLTGYTFKAQSVEYEDLSWRVLGYDETKDELLLISTTPTTENGVIGFYGPVGYNNYENVLKNTCSKLYSNTSIGATARSITMNDIDTYLGGSSFTKTTFNHYGDEDSVTSRFNIDETGTLVKLGEDDESVELDLISNAYDYCASHVITDATKLDLLQGSNSASPFYYHVAVRSYRYDSGWCLGDVSWGYVSAHEEFIFSGRTYEF